MSYRMLCLGALTLCLASAASAHDFQKRGPSAGDWATIHSEIAKGWATGEGLAQDHTKRFTQKTCLSRIGGVQLKENQQFAGSITSKTIVTGSVTTYCQ
ncbi:MAG: hypothetical protein AAGI34_02340 [Pseudomonadota bacterium]